MTGEPNYMVCQSCDRAPAIMVQRRQCSRCQGAIWLSEGSIAVAERENLALICWDCAQALGLFNGAKLAEMQPEQLRELADYFGQRDGRN
jgi:hypothetical protein